MLEKISKSLSTTFGAYWENIFSFYVLREAGVSSVKKKDKNVEKGNERGERDRKRERERLREVGEEEGKRGSVAEY